MPAGLVLAGALVTGLLTAAPVQAAHPSAHLPTASTPTQAAAVQAADAKDPIQVVVDDLRPVVPAAGDLLRISGRVVSTASVPVTDVSVQIRRSSAPVTTRKQIAHVVAAPLEPADGSPDDVPLPGTRVVAATSLAPGATAPFSLRVPIDRLGLSGPGTYVLAVEALGREQGIDEFDARQGVLRTFLPWYPEGSDVTPIDLTWLWPLADWPARAPDGVLIGNRTPNELSVGGRLDTILRVGRRHQDTVSWVADPSLLQTAAAMSGGYQVQIGGQLVVGDKDDQARRWLSQVSEVAAESTLRVLPYADADAAAVTRAGMSNDVVRAVTQAAPIAREATGHSVDGGLYWAPFGRIDRATLDVLASAGITTVVLSADALPATGDDAATAGDPTASVPTSVGSIRAVLTDPQLGAVLAGPQRTASDVIVARQQFLAQTAVLAQTLPADGVRSVVVGPSDVRWTATASLLTPLLRATRTAPWLSAQTLHGLLDLPASSTSRKRGGYGQKAREAELAPAYLAQVARQSDNLDVFTSILDDPTGISEPFAQSLLRAESAGWRTEPETGARLLTAITRQLSDLTERVHVLSEGTVTFSGDTGRVPVTIVNDLDRAVTVGLALRGRPALRLHATPLSDIAIEAGKMASVDVDARVVGGDPLAVDVQLLAPDGEEFGRPAPIEVRSTAYARAAAWVVAASFLAIAIFVLVGIVRRIRTAQRQRRSGSVTT